MKKLNKIVFFGNERLVTGVEETPLYCLNSLHKAGFEIVAIISHFEPARSRKARPLEVRAFAEKYNIPLLLPDKLDSIKNTIKSLGAEIGVLVAYGKLISPEIINLFPKGVINLHPSLLPIYRGPTPIEQALLDGVNVTGVSIMQLEAGLDSGPLFAQESIKVGARETKFKLADQLLKVGAALIVKTLPSILEGKLKPLPQNETDATFTQLITKADGKIDWTKPAEMIEREIRAYSGWPGSYTEIANTSVTITQVRLSEQHGLPGDIFVLNKELGIFTGNGSLIIELLKPAGKPEMTGQAFITGRGVQL